MLALCRRNALGVDRRDAACQHGKRDDPHYHLMRPNFHMQPARKAIATAIDIAMHLRSVFAFVPLQ
jgi:hypothetical protein